jgi:hypothetical protein
MACFIGADLAMAEEVKEDPFLDTPWTVEAHGSLIFSARLLG